MKLADCNERCLKNFGCKTFIYSSSKITCYLYNLAMNECPGGSFETQTPYLIGQGTYGVVRIQNMKQLCLDCLSLDHPNQCDEYLKKGEFFTYYDCRIRCLVSQPCITSDEPLPLKWELQPEKETDSGIAEENQNIDENNQENGSDSKDTGNRFLTPDIATILADTSTSITDTRPKNTVVTFLECYWQLSANSTSSFNQFFYEEESTSFSEDGGLNYLVEMEQKFYDYKCAGLCEKPLFYISRNLTDS